MTGKSILWRACLSAFCVLALTVTSCSMLISEENKIPEVFEVTLTSETAGALESEITVIINCDLSWSASLSDTSWGQITEINTFKGKGGTFCFSFDWNTSDTPRENSIIIRAGKLEVRKTVKQEGMTTFFQPGSVTLTGTQPGRVSFNAPCDWNAEITKGSDWLTLKSASGKTGSSSLELVAKDANENIGSRDATVKIDFGKASFQIPVTQGQTDVILLTSGSQELQASWEGMSFNVDTGTNVEYKIEPQVSWIHHTQTKALNQATEVFQVDMNQDVSSRTGVIRFTGGDAQLSITVVQEGKDPLLNNTQPGVYGIVKGENYVYGANGWNQKGLKLNGKDINFLFMNRKDASLVSLTTSGIDFSKDGNTLTLNPSAGTSFDVNVIVYKDGNKVFTDIVPFSLLYTDNNLVWFKAEDNSCFIVNYQEAI